MGTGSMIPASDPFISRYQNTSYLLPVSGMNFICGYSGCGYFCHPKLELIIIIIIIIVIIDNNNNNNNIKIK